jgi:hypothetical protein
MLTTFQLITPYDAAVFVAEIGDGFYDTAVIGDFQEADAEAFLKQQPNAPSLTAEDWSTVYKVRALHSVTIGQPSL